MANTGNKIYIYDGPLMVSTALIKIGNPLKNAEYKSLDHLLAVYRGHAYGKGYDVVLCAQNNNKEGRRITYMCDRGGNIVDRNSKDPNPSKKRKNTGSRKTNCPFRIIAQEQVAGWRGFIMEENHSHEPSHDPIAHPSYRIKRLDANQEAKALVSSLLSRRTQVSTIRAQVRDNWVIELNAGDIYNFGQKIRSQELGGKTPINWLADALKDRRFFHRIDTDNNSRVTRLFFAHPECVKLLKENPDVILIDSTYQTNRFNMPMVNICGSCGGSETPQFAVEFLSGEKKDVYMWVMNYYAELLREYEIFMPKCFVTDRELALINTLNELFPESDHILCRWHINMNVVAKTKRFFKDQDTFVNFYSAWNALIISENLEAHNFNLVQLREKSHWCLVC